MNRDPKFWRMKDGKQLFIPDMGDKHLVNTIKYLEKKFGAQQVTEWPVYKNLWSEMEKRELDYDGTNEWDN